MRHPIRTVNRDKAHLLPVRNPFKSREAENYRVQDSNTASLWVVSYSAGGELLLLCGPSGGCVDIEGDARAVQLQ